MVGESNQNVFLNQIDASSFAEFEISEFEISRVYCIDFVQVIVILVTVGLASLNTWSFIQLKHDFDPSMYLPTDSYSQKYVEADRKYFPDDGAFVQLYCSE